MLIAGKGKVWDAKRNRVLCVFGQNGLLNTDDPYVIKELLAKGYEEVKTNELVSIYECNAVNVDWKQRYEAEHTALMALRTKYNELEKILKDIEDNTCISVAPEPVDVAEKQAIEDLAKDYVFGDIVVPRDYAKMPAPKLKSLLKKLDGLQGKSYPKVTKEEAIALMAQLIEREGLDK